MAWIRVIHEHEADDALRCLYESIAAVRGKVANIVKVQSLRPNAMKAHIDLYKTVMFEASGITRAEREMIAVAVSSANCCAYIAHHAEALRHYWEDPMRLQALIEQREVPGLSDRGRAMLKYAVKLTKHPHEITEDDAQALRAQGLSDIDILDLTQVVAYFSFVNRIALGLGVESSEEEMRGYKL